MRRGIGADREEIIIHLSRRRPELHGVTRRIFGHGVKTSFKTIAGFNPDAVQVYEGKMRRTFLMRRFLVLGVIVGLAALVVRAILAS